MWNRNYDLVGSLFPGSLFAFSQPSQSNHEVSEQWIFLEGAAPAQQVGSHIAQLTVSSRRVKEGMEKAKQEGGSMRPTQNLGVKAIFFQNRSKVNKLGMTFSFCPRTSGKSGLCYLQLENLAVVLQPGLHRPGYRDHLG